MKKVNVDIKFGEPRLEVFIPVYIGDKRMKDIHTVVKDGEYGIVKEDIENCDDTLKMCDKAELIANFDRLYNNFDVIPREDRLETLSNTLNLAMKFIEKYCS